MGNWKKFALLILSLMLFTQYLIAGKANVGISPASTCLFGGSSNTFSSFAGAKPGDTYTSESLDITGNQLADKESWFVKGVAKYKKKYKRNYTSSTRLKPPVKDIDSLPVNIFAKETYSKPHFLSHLHHFLFRLTPF